MSEDRLGPSGEPCASESQCTLMEQYKIAVQLYRHEDELNWTKLNHLFYVNGGLLIMAGWCVEAMKGPNQWNPSVAVPSGAGVLVCLAFTISLWAGTAYLQHHKKRAVAIEEALGHHGGAPVLRPQGHERGRWLLEKSPTRWMLRSVPILILLFWLFVLVVGPRAVGGSQL